MLQMDEANEIIDEVLNPQSELLWKWRQHLVNLLSQPLDSREEEVDGQEYTRSLETQGEAETYLQAYSALVADRREALTSERTLLTAHESREKKSRKTKAANKAAAAALEEDVIMQLGDLEPEHEVMLKELHEERKAILEDYNSPRAVRSVLVDLNNIATKIVNDEDPEKIIAKQGAARLRDLITSQSASSLLVPCFSSIL